MDKNRFNTESINHSTSILLHVVIQIALSLRLFLHPTSPSLQVRLRLRLRVAAVLLVAVQVGNMNYLAGKRGSAWKTAVSTVRMDE